MAGPKPPTTPKRKRPPHEDEPDVTRSPASAAAWDKDPISSSTHSELLRATNVELDGNVKEKLSEMSHYLAESLATVPQEQRDVASQVLVLALRRVVLDYLPARQESGSEIMPELPEREVLPARQERKILPMSSRSHRGREGTHQSVVRSPANPTYVKQQPSEAIQAPREAPSGRVTRSHTKASYTADSGDVLNQQRDTYMEDVSVACEDGPTEADDDSADSDSPYAQGDLDMDDMEGTSEIDDEPGAVRAAQENGSRSTTTAADLHTDPAPPTSAAATVPAGKQAILADIKAGTADVATMLAWVRSNNNGTLASRKGKMEHVYVPWPRISVAVGISAGPSCKEQLGAKWMELEYKLWQFARSDPTDTLKLTSTSEVSGAIPNTVRVLASAYNREGLKLLQDALEWGLVGAAFTENVVSSTNRAAAEANDARRSELLNNFGTSYRHAVKGRECPFFAIYSHWRHYVDYQREVRLLQEGDPDAMRRFEPWDEVGKKKTTTLLRFFVSQTNMAEERSTSSNYGWRDHNVMCGALHTAIEELGWTVAFLLGDAQIQRLRRVGSKRLRPLLRIFKRECSEVWQALEGVGECIVERWEKDKSATLPVPTKPLDRVNTLEDAWSALATVYNLAGFVEGRANAKEGVDTDESEREGHVSGLDSDDMDGDSSALEGERGETGQDEMGYGADGEDDMDDAQMSDAFADLSIHRE